MSDVTHNGISFVNEIEFAKGFDLRQAEQSFRWLAEDKQNTESARAMYLKIANMIKDKLVTGMTAASEYDKSKAEACAASVDDVARWLEGQHDYAEQRNQPWLARAAEMLRALERVPSDSCRAHFYCPATGGECDLPCLGAKCQKLSRTQ